MSPLPAGWLEWMTPTERAAFEYLYDHHRERVLHTTRDWAYTEGVLWALNKGGFLRAPEEWCEKCDRVTPPGGSPTCVACGSEGSTGGETAPD